MSVLDFSVKTAELGDDVFIVSVTGEADLYRAPQLEGALQGVLGLGGTSVAVDFAEVSFIDSTILHVLLRFQQRFRSRGGEVVLVSDDRRVLRTFEIIGLERIFPIERRLDAAVQILRSR
jgi:anti-sigma B factor antagonist